MLVAGYWMQDVQEQQVPASIRKPASSILVRFARVLYGRQIVNGKQQNR